VTRYVYRPVSVPLATAIARTSVTPVQVTWLSALLAVGGAVAFALGAYVAGGFLTLAGIITDCVDGDLARITGRSSSFGAFLDSVLDRLTDGAMIIGLGMSDPDRFGVVAGFALLASLLTSYVRARAQSLGADCPEGIGGRDARILILVVAAFTGYVFAGLLLVAVFGGITTLHRAVNAGRHLRAGEPARK
jgi:phosphatidylglycerophosphate synthase